MTIDEIPRVLTWRITTELMLSAEAARVATTPQARRDLLIGAAGELRIRLTDLDSGTLSSGDLDVLRIDVDDAGLVPTADQTVADALELIQNHGAATRIGLRVLSGALVRDVEGSTATGSGTVEARTAIGFSAGDAPEPIQVSLDTGALAKILDLDAARIDEPTDLDPS